ncbi:MAG: hypothetical protein NZM12_09835 [Steroidobacteraceae bacterium]|nr:hypothetical protein [Steroidobacteraceae bacterium]MDW8260202.1 hypothetical protein [Gammaproteobacteria bacterium]
MTSVIALVERLPWLEAPRHQLRTALQRSRAPQALLLQSPEGCGGAEFATWTAALALCRDAQRAPCGACRDCLWVAEQAHPDLLLVGPLEAKRDISIEQVRETIEVLQMTSHRRGRRAAILSPADALSRSAANALLKLLEEPPGTALLILCAVDLARLPATVRSRCLRLRVRPPRVTAAAEWLASQRGGAPAECLDVLQLYGNRPLELLRMDFERLRALGAQLRHGLARLGDDPQAAVALGRQWADDDYEVRLLLLENLVTKRCEELVESSAVPLRGGPLLTTLRRMIEFRDNLRQLRSLAPMPLNRAFQLQHLLATWSLGAVA